MVLPIILLAGALAIGWIISWFTKPPVEENNTMREIEERIKQDKEEKENERRHEERLKEIKLERQKTAAEREKAQVRLAELAAEERRQSEERERNNARDVKQAEKEVQRVNAEHQEREKKVEAERQRLHEYEKEMKKKELVLEEETRKAKELVEKEREARLRAENGLQQDRWPTREEYERGRQLIEYSADKLHFAIIGKSGSGKSSLINAFLGYSNKDPMAAKTGITETTSKISRYPDRGEQEPRPWTVWYDVPGAGTQNISAWQYFINQGLFVFDIILIAIGDRFEETDVQLLRDCNRFKIPALIVRSKADMHIDNLIKAQGEWRRGEAVDEEIYQECRDEFVTESEQMVYDELAKARIPGQEVYLVSSYILRKVYNCSLNGLESNLTTDMIDEETLIREIMLLAIQRRGGDVARAAVEVAMKGDIWAKKTTQVGRNMIQAASSLALNALRRQDTERVDDGAPRQVDQPQQMGQPQQMDQPRQMGQLWQPNQNTSNMRSKSGGSNHSSQQRHVPWLKRVIYLPEPVRLDQLQQELNACNPNLSEMFAAQPRMLSSTTAVLNFLPGQLIPEEIAAFGCDLSFHPYGPRPEGAKKNTDSHRDALPPYNSTQPASLYAKCKHKR